MDKHEAILEIADAIDRNDPGDCSNTAFEALGISFDTFLRFAQSGRDSQMDYLKSLLSYCIVRGFKKEGC